MALERSKGWRGLAAWILHFGQIIALGTGLPLVGLSPASAAEPPPVADFFREPQISQLVMSPSGKRAAIVLSGADGFLRLAVMDLQPQGRPRQVASYTDADIRWVAWTSDDRLVYTAWQRGEIEIGGGGTFAVNHDGSESRQLITAQWTIRSIGALRTIRTLTYDWSVVDTTDDGSDDVYVIQREYDRNDDVKAVPLARLNTRTGELKDLSKGAPDNVRQWLLDSRKEPRVVTTVGQGRQKIFWRQPGQTAWTQIADFDDYGGDGFDPWQLESESVLLVRARAGSDFTAIHRFDLAKRQLDPTPLVAVRGFDLHPTAEVDRRAGTLVGLHFVADRPMSYWFNDDLARLQKSIDAALPPGRINRLLCGRCESTRKIGIASYSDRMPGEYFIFDRDQRTLERLGARRPALAEDQQGRRSLHRVAARDGLSLPVIVTHPPGSTDKQALPTVLLVHGGPWIRGGDLRWSAQAQFLASRGYRVLEPEFRGSAGFGWQHFQAGWKEWGGRMQDDLADTVQWATRQGLTDGQRVCVMGGSYGGYAALMAPIVHPGVFRCSVAFAAVTDLRMLYEVTWSDVPEEYKRYGMPKLVGALDTDGALLDRASPLKRVTELKLPVLLAHGHLDRRVPRVHADRFADAAKAAGVPVERVIYEKDGHGFWSPDSTIDYYQKVEAFLGKHLGSAPR